VTWVPAVVVSVLAVVTTASFVLSAWSEKEARRARSRVDLLTAALNSAVVLVLLHQLLPWSSVPVALWLVPVLLVAGGVAGAVLRWPGLPWLRPDRARWRVVSSAAVEVVVAIAVVVVLVVL
jgi:hypothetical protein